MDSEHSNTEKTVDRPIDRAATAETDVDAATMTTAEGAIGKAPCVRFHCRRLWVRCDPGCEHRGQTRSPSTPGMVEGNITYVIALLLASEMLVAMDDRRDGERR